MPLSEDVMDILTEHVCEIADLRSDDDWPNEVKALVGAARQVKRLYGMEVVRIGTD